MTTAVFPSTLKPMYQHTRTRRVRSLVTTFENGTEQRAYLMTAPREWDYVFRGTKAEIQALETFWNTVHGNVESFTLRLYDGTNSTVSARFKDEELKIECQGQDLWECSVTFREVL